MTEVVRIHYGTPTGWEHDPQYVYIGRAGRGHGGYFGNPLGTLVGYPEWLVEKLRTDRGFREAVRGLAGKTLVCFCKPKPCHGDQLAMWADLLASGDADRWLDLAVGASR